MRIQRMASVGLALALTAGVAGFTVMGEGSSPKASAAAVATQAKSPIGASGATCDQLIKHIPAHGLNAKRQGWKIRCVNRFKGKRGLINYGWADFGSKTISVLRRPATRAIEEDMYDTIAHEWAHAESGSWGQPGFGATALWVKLINHRPAKGQSASDAFWNPKFPKSMSQGDRYYFSPVEQWAQARSRCSGWGNPRYDAIKLQPCSKVNQIVHYLNQQNKQK